MVAKYFHLNSKKFLGISFNCKDFMKISFMLNLFQYFAETSIEIQKI